MTADDHVEGSERPWDSAHGGGSAGFGDAPPATASTGLGHAPLAAASTGFGSASTGKLFPGERLNERFLIEELAATGGMGSVYRAKDLATGELVAVKALVEERGSSRFARESSVLADLSHPAVVRYIARGTSNGGVPFLVMEWLAGEDLSQSLRRRGLTVNESLALVRRVTEGLALAHARGVIHRDIKPSNLFVVGHDPGAVKIVDFGIARLTAAEQTLTRAGGMLGTVGYMAPEQAMGAEDVDARADIFALGCVLFECLTGRPAFAGQHDIAVLAKLLRDDPPPVSELRPELGDALDAFVQRLLAKNPDERPRDAAELLGMLDTLGALAGDRPPARTPEARRLTGSEQRIVSAILGRVRGSALATLAPDVGGAEASQLQALSLRFGADPVPLPGALLFLMSSRGAATDLAQRAARCALALSDLRRDLALAVATGSVDTSSRVPVGIAIDRAASLLEEALHGGPGIALDEATSGLLGARFEVRRAGAGSFLMAEVDPTDRPQLLMGKPTPYVGREKELALLEATLDECVSDGVARAVLVTGAPGIGKSRLGLEFGARVRGKQSARTLVARADPVAAGAPLSLAQRLVRHAASLREGDPELEQRARLRAYLNKLVIGATTVVEARAGARERNDIEARAGARERDDVEARAGAREQNDIEARAGARSNPRTPRERPGRVGRGDVLGRTASDTSQWLAEFLGELIALPALAGSPLLRAARNDPEVMREQTRRAFLRWIEAEVAHTPLVILLEDLHWGDLTTLTYVEELLQEFEQRPILVVATARPEVHQLFPKLQHSAHMQEIRLRGLTRRAAERLAHAALPADTHPDVLQRIVELADGNAFYLEELIRRVAEGGTELPETVLAMARSRLELLEPEARRVLRAASVFGETFWTGAVRELLGGGADEEYWLDFLADREIILLRPETRFPYQREYAFRHALLRDAAYAMLTPEDRAVAHRLAGDWLERSGEREALVLADHFEQGGAPERALPQVVRAAAAALDAGDLAGAAALARRGLDLGPGSAERGVLLLVQAYASVYGMRTDMHALAEALSLLPTATAYWWLALSLLIFGSAAVGKPEEAKPYMQLALETPPGPELTGMYGAAMQALAAGMVLMGRADAAWPLIDRFEHVSNADPNCDLLFLAWLNLARCQLAVTSPVHGAWQLERALLWGREAEQAMRVAGSASGHVTALFYLGNASRIVGCYAESEQALTRCAERAAKLGNNVLRQYSQLILSLVWIRQGRTAQAHELLRLLSVSPDPNIVHGAQAVSAEARFRERALDEALRIAMEAASGPASPYRRMAYSTLARTHLALAEPELALASTDRALREGAAANPEFESDLLATRAQALAALGRSQEAADTIRRAEAFVQAVAQQIGDPELRKCFLGELDGTARVMALARGLRGV